MTKTHTKILSDRQKKALPFFVSCKSYGEGCRQSGVSKNAFYSWLQEPAFKEELNRMQDEVVVNALQNLKSNMTRATDVLVSLLDRKENPSLLRFVCNDIIPHITRAVQI